MDKNGWQINKIIANAIGILALCGLIVLTVFALTATDKSQDMGLPALLGCIVMIPFGLYSWSNDDKLNARDWFVYFLMFLGLTVVFFLMDCGVGNLFHPGLPLCTAGTNSFGFFFTLLSGGAAAVYLVGSLRALVMVWMTTKRKSKIRMR